ncbi:hypothetical protein [Burkholderia latens]
MLWWSGDGICLLMKRLNAAALSGRVRMGASSA